VRTQRLQPILSLGLSLLAAGCVSYRAETLRLEEVDAALAERGPPPGRLDFAAAVRYAHGHNPELRALLAEARAAGWDVPATDLDAGANFNRDHVDGSVDPLAILRIGPRGAAFALAEASRVEVLARLRAAQLRIAADIAEAFAVERVLDRYLPPGELSGREPRRPELPDGERFQEAGLAGEVDLDLLRHAKAAESAEWVAIQHDLAANRADLRRLLGAGSAARLALIALDEPDPPVPAEGDARLFERPDLAVALARHAKADAALRLAVADQYPSLRLGGEFNLDAPGSGWLVRVRIPLGAHRRAKAAEARREAARLDVEAALLEARNDAVARTAAYWTAETAADAARAAKDASYRLAEVALVRLENDGDGFRQAVEANAARITRSAEARRAQIAAARARVRLAEAYAWPLVAEEGQP